MIRRNAIGVAAALTALGLSGPVAAETINAGLSTHQEVPAVSSGAIGQFRAFINDKAGTISYELSYDGLAGPVRMAHIHIGQRSVNGGVMVWLCQTASFVDPTGLAPQCPASGSVSGLVQAANVTAVASQGIAAGGFAELVAAIRAGVAYVNVHTDRFPGGELRGQLH